MKKTAPSMNNLFIEGEISPKGKNGLRLAEPKTMQDGGDEHKRCPKCRYYVLTNLCPNCGYEFKGAR